MSKLIIRTQYRENYGAHEWNGKGEAPQSWKNKGGQTYVVRDLTTAQANKIKEKGIPTLTNLIEYANPVSEEFVVDYNIVDDMSKECEPWETQTIFAYKNNEWVCQTHHTFHPDEYPATPITCKAESWKPKEGNKRTDYVCHYKTPSGWLDADSEQLKKELKESSRKLEKLA